MTAATIPQALALFLLAAGWGLFSHAAFGSTAGGLAAACLGGALIAGLDRTMTGRR